MKVINPVPGDLAGHLEGSRIHSHMGPQDLSLLLAVGQLVEYETGEQVIEEGSESDDMYIVIDGTVVIEMDAGKGPVYVCTLGSGEVIGEAGLFIHVRRTATVRATEGSRLVRFPRSRFFDLLRKEPQCGIRFLFLIIYSLLGRLRDSNAELVFERRLDMRQDDVDRMVDDLIPPDARELLESLRIEG